MTAITKEIIEVRPEYSKPDLDRRISIWRKKKKQRRKNTNVRMFPTSIRLAIIRAQVAKKL